MKLPILAYGNTALTVFCDPITTASPELEALVADMWETMEDAEGCGLAAPQVGVTKQLFIVDSVVMYEDADDKERQATFADGDVGIRETFINAEIIGKSDEEWDDLEGCLSIPEVYRNVSRPWGITIAYLDGNYTPQEKTFYGMTARIIQHEYDHIRGVLFIDRLNPVTRKLINVKLNKITKGKVFTSYQMKY